VSAAAHAAEVASDAAAIPAAGDRRRLQFPRAGAARPPSLTTDAVNGMSDAAETN
jgi:hypothetical protein